MYDQALDRGPWTVSLFVSGVTNKVGSNTVGQTYPPHGRLQPVIEVKGGRKITIKGRVLTITAEHTATANGDTYDSVTNGCVIP